MSATITTILLGIVIVILGISNIRDNISSIHRYHRHRVLEENKKIFGKYVGTGTLIIGIAMIVFGGMAFLTELAKNNIYIITGSILLIISIIVGMTLSFYAMIKYNKGIF